MKKITRLPITKLWLIAILLISISSVTTLIIKSLLFNKNDTTESNSTPSVVPEKIGIAAVGRLEPVGEVVNLAVPPDREGAKVQELLVKVGDRVESGAIVAILDNRDRICNV
jgi:HlyD family secretion protein